VSFAGVELLKCPLLAPILGSFSGSATVPVASVGVPPTEHGVADK